MKVVLLALLLFSGMGGEGARAETPFASHAKLALRKAVANRQTVGRYERLELTLSLSAAYNNPFDPEQIDVTATFTSPQGQAVRVNGFLDQPFTRRRDGSTERIEPAGDPVWKVRFAPDTVGTWRYRVTARDRSGTVRLPEARFSVKASADPGFVRRSRRNPLVFAFADERPFFAVGENMGWAGDRGTGDYDDWLPALGKAGGNWIRIWMSAWNAALEWTPVTSGTWGRGRYYGVGVYSLDNAWKLDTILDAAEQNGLYTMLCFGTYGEFTTGGFFNEGLWNRNPYNAVNGGPCARPEEFWTNLKARALYRQRLRYITARYGCRTHIQAWEFWNETNAPASWVREMAQYLRGAGPYRQDRPADPYRHLLTTTYGDDAVWKLPEIDFTQSHHYGEGNVPDHAPVVHSDAIRYLAYDKPHLMAEFGIDWRDSDRKYDPGGRAVNFHNGLWAGTTSGDAGGAMLWWWDNYVAPLNLYAPLGALRRFVDTVAWTEGAWKPAELDAPKRIGGPENFTDLTLAPGGMWGKASDSEFTLTPKGIAGDKMPSQFLYGPEKADLRTTPTLIAHFAHPGQFRVRVNEVSNFGRLQILLDGNVVGDWKVSAVPPAAPNVKPEYEQTTYRREYGIYQARFNRDYAIEVPAGEHRITLQNAEGDWLTVASITLTGCRSDRYPQVNLYGLTDGKRAILWAQNALHNWQNVADKKPIPVVQNAVTVVRGLPPGRYAVAWWDTWKGVVTKRETAACAEGALPLHLPDLATDVAACIVPLK